MTVQKAVELIGTGPTIQDAVTEALDRARLTLDGITSFEMADITGVVDGAVGRVPRRAARVVHAAGAHARMNGITRVVLPIGVNAVQSVNCYVLADGDRVTVVDCGVWRPDLPDGGLAALTAGLNGAGYALARRRRASSSRTRTSTTTASRARSWRRPARSSSCTR